MSAEEFGMWQAAYSAEPWGEARIDLAGGIVAATVANCNRGKDTRAYVPFDFMPLARANEPPPPEDDALTFFQALS